MTRVVSLADVHIGFRAGWSPLERRHLDGLKTSMRAIEGDGLEWIEGATEDGSPWIVAIDIDGDEMVLHLARIDRQYVALTRDLSIQTQSARLDQIIDGVLSNDAPKLPATIVRGVKFRSDPFAMAITIALLIVEWLKTHERNTATAQDCNRECDIHLFDAFSFRAALAATVEDAARETPAQIKRRTADGQIELSCGAATPLATEALAAVRPGFMPKGYLQLALAIGSLLEVSRAASARAAESETEARSAIELAELHGLVDQQGAATTLLELALSNASSGRILVSSDRTFLNVQPERTGVDSGSAKQDGNTVTLEGEEPPYLLSGADSEAQSVPVGEHDLPRPPIFDLVADAPSVLLMQAMAAKASEIASLGGSTDLASGVGEGTRPLFDLMRVVAIGHFNELAAHLVEGPSRFAAEWSAQVPFSSKMLADRPTWPDRHAEIEATGAFLASLVLTTTKAPLNVSDFGGPSETSIGHPTGPFKMSAMLQTAAKAVATEADLLVAQDDHLEFLEFTTVNVSLFPSSLIPPDDQIVPIESFDQALPDDVRFIEASSCSITTNDARQKAWPPFFDSFDEYPL